MGSLAVAALLLVALAAYLSLRPAPCGPRADDPQQYLLRICEHVRANNIDVSPADPGRYRIKRLDEGAADDEPFVAPLHADKPFSRHTLRKRYRTACRVLGKDRLQTLTIHHGRHTFISHALAGGRTLAEVRDAAGHANVSVTSAYLHVAVEDDEMGNLFSFRP